MGNLYDSNQQMGGAFRVFGRLLVLPHGAIHACASFPVGTILGTVKDPAEAVQ